MLTQVAEGVFVHESEFCQSNAIVVLGSTGALLIDAGVLESEFACLANDVAALGQPVVAGFSTHPHWDHMLWAGELGDVPRFATAACVESATARLANGIDTKRLGIPDGVSLELVGMLTALPAGTTTIPWGGPEVQIIEHNAHATGHGSLLIGGTVLVAGDMLSDVLIPLLDLSGAADPLGDYLAGLNLLEERAGHATVVIPGHGSVGGNGETLMRIGNDRAYVTALRDGASPEDQRIGESPKPGWEWVRGVHEWQASNLATAG